MPSRPLALVALLLICGTAGIGAGQSADQNVNVTVAVQNHLSVREGATLEFAVGANGISSDARTVLEFGTNDGRSYSILVEAPDGWSFKPAVPGNQAGTYPVLRFLKASASAGVASLASATLIGADNSTLAAVEVASGIVSTAGTATVELEMTSEQTVVAGSYRASLSYTLTAP